MKLTNRVILLIIIITASVLRFYNFFNIPFTYDEFSALFRTQFTSFSELIEKGVKPDGHPAGVQVFLYYWVKLWGMTEWIVKLPFILCGIASVYLLFEISKKWYNETVGLIAASFLTSVQYTIMYSQIARPYISGLFFSLLMVNYWTNLMLAPQKKFTQNSILFILSASLCAYNHYISLLFAMIVGLSGLFLIQRKFLMKYIFSGLSVFILFIPHFQIFLHQFSMGGIEEWLGKPHNDFIVKYISYLFHYSYYLLILVIVIVFVGFFSFEKREFKRKPLILFSCWFILPFLFTFFYSKYVNSILQFSMLIFSFPYLYFMLFGHIKSLKVEFNLLLVTAILSVNIFSLIVERQNYKILYNLPYEKIVADYDVAEKMHPGKTASIIDLHPDITNFYINKCNINSGFEYFDSFENQQELISFLQDKSKTNDFLYFGFLSGNNHLTIPIIQNYYPKIEIQNNYAQGASYLFSKEKTVSKNSIEKQDFENSIKTYWSPIDKNNLCDSVSFSGKTSYFIDSITEWSASFSIPFMELNSNETDFIDLSVKAYLPNKFDDIIFVATLELGGKSIYWEGARFDRFILSKNEESEKWVTINNSIKLSDLTISDKNNTLLKVFIWNKGRQRFYIDDVEISRRDGNPIVYAIDRKIMKRH